VFINAVPAKKSTWKASATLTAVDENRCYSNRRGKNGTKQTLMIQSVKTVMGPFFGNDFYFAPKHVTKDKEGENNVLGNGGQLFNQLANGKAFQMDFLKEKGILTLHLKVSRQKMTLDYLKDSLVTTVKLPDFPPKRIFALDADLLTVVACYIRYGMELIGGKLEKTSCNMVMAVSEKDEWLGRWDPTDINAAFHHCEHFPCSDISAHSFHPLVGLSEGCHDRTVHFVSRESIADNRLLKTVIGILVSSRWVTLQDVQSQFLENFTVVHQKYYSKTNFNEVLQHLQITLVPGGAACNFTDFLKKLLAVMNDVCRLEMPPVEEECGGRTSKRRRLAEGKV
jgi:hypothetical protein